MRVSRNRQPANHRSKANREQDNKERDNRERDNRERDNKERGSKERDNKVRDNRARDNRERDSKARDNKVRGSKVRDSKSVLRRGTAQGAMIPPPQRIRIMKQLPRMGRRKMEAPENAEVRRLNNRVSHPRMMLRRSSGSKTISTSNSNRRLKMLRALERLATR
tara:strand:- start:860 stop:1351 length:492 start_codon:yes stop_codon:yes gene_type:complete